MERLGRVAAANGIIFAVMLAASIITSGNTPGSDATGAAVITYYKANKNSQGASTLFAILAVVFFAFFGAILWNRLRRVLAESALPAAGLVGVALTAVGGAIFASLTFALTDAPDKIDPSTAQALNVLNNDLFFPFALGVTVFLIANGLAIARSGFLPRWLGWIGIIIGLTAATPIGVIGFFGSGAWVLVVSVMMLVGDLRSAPGPAAAPAA